MTNTETFEDLLDAYARDTANGSVKAATYERQLILDHVKRLEAKRLRTLAGDTLIGTVYTHVHVEAPDGTEDLHDVLYEWAGCFGCLEDTYVGLDVKAIFHRADSFRDMHQAAWARGKPETWAQIQALLDAARDDQIDVLILAW